MFIQVIQGDVRDEPALRAQLDRWAEELGPDADGWLGTTAGLATQGGFIAVVRFESDQAARRNSDRPEQGRWWAQTAESLGEVTFHDCAEVDLMGSGGSDEAGFVQVIQGRVSDQQRVRELNERFGAEMASVRPDVLGGTIAWHGDGGFTQTVYFTSEAEARAGERKDMPEEFGEYANLFAEARYFDLPDPWFSGPRS